MFRPQEHLCRVVGLRDLTPTVFELFFEADPALSFHAGQFVSVVVPKAGPKGADLRRAYSIASGPAQHPIELCIKRMDGGPGTAYLSSLKVGDSFRAFAPYGAFIYRPKSDRALCFVATGTGVAPFRSILLSAEFRAALPSATTCVLGVREESELLYASEFASIASLYWVPVVSRPTQKNENHFVGRVTDYFRSLPEDYPWGTTDFYLCGNGAMIEDMRKLLTEKGVQRPAIHQEIYFRPPAPVTHAAD